MSTHKSKPKPAGGFTAAFKTAAEGATRHKDLKVLEIRAYFMKEATRAIRNRAAQHAEALQLNADLDRGSL